MHLHLAIGADSLHYRGDLMVNLAVIATLAVVEATGALWVDAAVAIAIAGYLLWSAIAIARHSLDALMDRELPDDDRRKIREVVAAQPGVLALHDLRTRAAGPNVFIQLHLEMDGRMSLYDAHAVADAVKGRAPGVPVSCSADVVAEYREFERFSTTVLNAYLQPLMEGYLTSLEERLLATGYTHGVLTVASSGGMMTTDTARRLPIKTIFSGPAGGVSQAVPSPRRPCISRTCATA